MSTVQEQEIEVLIRARYPLLFVVSWEEDRVGETLQAIGKRTGKKVYEWSCSGGIAPAGTPLQAGKLRNAGTRDPIVALDEVVNQMEPAIYLFKDFHPFLARNNFTIIRKLRDIAVGLKSSYKTVVLVSPFLELPAELEKDVTVVDYQLPTLVELGVLLDRIVEEVKGNAKIHIDLGDGGREEILKAALGLTLAEAENVFAKSIVRGGSLSRADVDAIFAEKQQVIRKSGLLDYCAPEEDFGQVGGLVNLKDWLGKRRLAFTDKAEKFGLPPPKGVLLLGVQGCGKSLSAKAVSNLWHLPLLRLDVGRLFSSLVGSSEENIRRAIRIAESVAPCVMWVDEIDKAFGALGGGGSTDSGTSQRVLGTFLTWLAEKTSSVFVIATANNIHVLPPELLRKGRFDDIFFIDLPNEVERTEIFALHLGRRGRDPERFDVARLVAGSAGLSGAEIEQAVVSALFDAFYEDRDVETEDLARALRETVPLSKTMEEEITKLREWCTARARPASVPQEEAAFLARRKLELV